MTKSFKEYVFYFLLIGLAITSIYAWATNIGTRYDADLSVNDKQIDLTKIQKTVNDTAESARNQEKAFRSDNPFVSTGALIMFGFWGAINSFWSIITSMFSLFLGGADFLGISPIVTGTLLSILLVALIFAAWRAIKAGE